MIMYKTLLNYKEKLGSLLEALPIKESYLATGPLASSIMSRSPELFIILSEVK